MTGSPGAKPVAPGPIVSTQPAFSWPRVNGSVIDFDPGGGLQQMEIRMAGTCAADLDQHLPWPWFRHRHVPELPRLLPLDELEGFDFATYPLSPSLRSP